jgi:hypothetical protein
LVAIPPPNFNAAPEATIITLSDLMFNGYGTEKEAPPSYEQLFP